MEGSTTAARWQKDASEVSAESGRIRAAVAAASARLDASIRRGKLRRSDTIKYIIESVMTT